MTRVVHLHVGLPKTGTTYLQDILWANKEALALQGVLLPGSSRRRHLLASLDIRDDPKLARRAGDTEVPWQKLVDEVLAWPGETAVITHEFFGAASSKQVARLVDSLEGCEVHATLTAREMVGLTRSRWQEWVKNGESGEIDSYPPSSVYSPVDEWGWGSFDLADILDRWGAVIPHERIHVLPVGVGSGDPVDLWQRFADVVGLDTRPLEVKETVSNPGLGVVEVELLRRINERLVGFESAGSRGRWIRDYLGQGSVLPRSREGFRASDATVADLVRRGDRAVQALRSGGFDVRGEIGLLEPLVPSRDLRRPGDVTEGELVDTAAQAIANLMTQVRSLTRERDDALRTQSLAPKQTSMRKFAGRVRRKVRRSRS